MNIPRLASQRLTLRPYKKQDFEAFAALVADEEVRRHTGGPLSRDQAARRFEKFVTGQCSPGNEVWAIACRESGEYVGHCWLVREGTDAPEMGFLIAAREWGQGYGTEVAQTLLDYARGEAGYPRVVATVDWDHVASIRILEQEHGHRSGAGARDNHPAIHAPSDHPRMTPVLFFLMCDLDRPCADSHIFSHAWLSRLGRPHRSQTHSWQGFGSTMSFRYVANREWIAARKLLISRWLRSGR